MEDELKKYVPPTWELSRGVEVSVDRHSEEFSDITKMVRNAVQVGKKEVQSIVRIQNLNLFGQNLLRQQFLQAESPQKDFYQVRRFLKINKQDVHTARAYNLDPRRLNLSNLVFLSQLQSCSEHDVIIIVQVITEVSHQHEITPERTTDYYLEYVAYMD